MDIDNNKVEGDKYASMCTYVLGPSDFSIEESSHRLKKQTFAETVYKDFDFQMNV